jgi:hypothetical protein
MSSRRADMQASWRNRKLRLTPAFILALLFGGEVETDDLNPNNPGAMLGWDADSFRLIVEEGRRQIDAQGERFRHVTDRAQTLLTVALVAVAFSAGDVSRWSNVDGFHRMVATLASCSGIALLLLGVGTAAAASVVSARFGAIDATRLTNEESLSYQILAVHYAKAVRSGETTLLTRVTLFRQAVRYICWGVAISSLAIALTW